MCRSWSSHNIASRQRTNMEGTMTTNTLRTFSPGDPGMPKNGLLVGGGGGIVLEYTDYVLHTDGLIEKLVYRTEGGPIPANYETVGSSTGSCDDIVDFMDKLTANGFWSQKSDPSLSTAVDYIVAVNQKKGAHVVEWRVNASDYPENIWLIRDDILAYAMKIIDT